MLKPKRHWHIMIFCETEFHNCFIIRSPSLFSYFNHFLAAQGSYLPFSLESVVQITHEQNIICSKIRILVPRAHDPSGLCHRGLWGRECKIRLERVPSGFSGMRDSAFFCGAIWDLSSEKGLEAGISVTCGSSISCFYRVGMRDWQGKQSGIRDFNSSVTSL